MNVNMVNVRLEIFYLYAQFFLHSTEIDLLNDLVRLTVTDSRFPVVERRSSRGDDPTFYSRNLKNNGTVGGGDRRSSVL